MRFVCPAAPISFSMGDGYGESRAWWMIDMERLQRALMLGQHREMAREVPEGLASAREKLAACLDEVERALRVETALPMALSRGQRLVRSDRRRQRLTLQRGDQARLRDRVLAR